MKSKLKRKQRNALEPLKKNDKVSQITPLNKK